MDALEAIRSRRSVRSYLDKFVPRDLLAALIEDGSNAPFTPISSGGAWRFTVLTGHDRISELGARALNYARANRPQLAGFEWTERHGFSVFHGAPAVIVISGREGLSVALEECTRAAQIVDIAARPRGLGLCWVGAPMMYLRSSEGLAELRIPDGWTPHVALAVGYTRELEPPPPSAPRPPLEVDWLEG